VQRRGAAPLRLDVWDPYQMWENRGVPEPARGGAESLLRELWEKR
jgi:hypothetical protein